jgi:hypothetical protein
MNEHESMQQFSVKASKNSCFQIYYEICEMKHEHNRKTRSFHIKLTFTLKDISCTYHLLSILLLFKFSLA